MSLREGAFVLAAGLLTLPASGRNLNPGKWQVTVDTEMQGLKMPPSRAMQCITPQQAESPDGAIPRHLAVGKDDDCRLDDLKTEGDTVTYRLSCARRQVTAEGSFHFAGDTYDGRRRIHLAGGELVQRFAGHRVGSCEQ